MATTFEVLYLGTGPEIDTVEGNVESENDSALVGMTFGSAEAPLAYGSQRTLSPGDFSGGSSTMYDIDNTLANDTFSIDGGPDQTFDGLAVYNATITYTDGTPPATITATVFQDTAGNIYLAPETTTNADYSAMIAAPIESITLDSIFPTTSNRMLAERQSTDFVCYSSGTKILTEHGEVAVEHLKAGDLVVTLDRGLQPIRWIHTSDHLLKDTAADAKPILIAAGALGSGRPEQDLIVSPQHRILVGGHKQLDAVVETEAFAMAKSLTKLKGIRTMRGKSKVTWIHFACDRHEIVFANGCLSESLLLGPMVVNGFTDAERQEVTGIFGHASAPDAALNGPPALKCLKSKDIVRPPEKSPEEKKWRIAKEIRKWDVDAAMERYEAGRLREADRKRQTTMLRPAGLKQDCLTGGR